MGRDFFDELGDTITRTTRDLGKRAGKVYEAQKLRNKISGEEHMVRKLKRDIGELVYKKFQAQEVVDEELYALCREIDQHMEIIAGYKDAAAKAKGRKICPSCKKAVDRSVAFCPYCGSPCPTVKPEKVEDENATVEDVCFEDEDEMDTDDTVEETVTEAASVESDCEDTETAGEGEAVVEEGHTEEAE